MPPRIDVVSINAAYRGGEIQNNVWVMGDDDAALVIDASHDTAPIVDTIAGRRVQAIVCTHGHHDHINRALDLAASVDAPVLLHPADRPLWDALHGARAPDRDLADGDVFTVAGVDLRLFHTPGHTPGSVCLHDARGRLFGGDTLFPGGPGATAHEYGDFELIIRSIRDRLLILPPDTEVLPGHGEPTTIGAEAPHLDEWIARGW